MLKKALWKKCHWALAQKHETGLARQGRNEKAESILGRGAGMIEAWETSHAQGFHCTQSPQRQTSIWVYIQISLMAQLHL